MMTWSRLPVALTLCLFAAPAVAAPSAAWFAETLEACLDEGNAWGAVKKIEKLGQDGSDTVWQVFMEKKNKRVLFFGESRDDCEVYPIGRAVDGGYGKLMGDGERRRLFLTMKRAGTCETDACALAAVVRDDKKNFLAVGRIGTACADTKVETLQGLLGKDHDAISVLCRAPAGGVDVFEQLVILTVKGNRVVPALSISRGMETGMEEERDGKSVMCVRKAPGSHKIKGKGKAAVIEAFVPEEDDAYSGEIATFAFDAEQGVFVKKSARPHTAKVEETCHPAK